MKKHKPRKYVLIATGENGFHVTGLFQSRSSGMKWLRANDIPTDNVQLVQVLDRHVVSELLGKRTKS